MVNLANLHYNLREPELYIALFCALYIAQNDYKIIVSNDGKELSFQVPPKTFSVDSWITELDHATNLVVSSKPLDRRLGKPECRKCCNETANIQFAMNAIDSHVDSLQYHRL